MTSRLWMAAVLTLPGIVVSTFAVEEPYDPFAVKEVKKSATVGGKVYSPDRSRFLINKEDARGYAQIYIGSDNSPDLTCITDVQRPGGPKADCFKMQPAWHASGRWIFLAVEREDIPWYIPRDLVEGWLQCGIWVNMYAVSPDGLTWHRLSDFKDAPGFANGYTGPALTSDGKTAVWSQIVQGSFFQYYPFGKWELIRADYVETNGVPGFTNLRNITPAGMNWNEPGNFHPDNESVLLTGSTNDADQQGMDQYILNIKTGALINLTNTPTVWDEHGLFSPDGSKLNFMSSYPYRSEPSASTVLGIKTEFMLINSDGSGLKQLTHFCEPGYPESHPGIAAVAGWGLDGYSLQLMSLVFPNYEFWDLTFQGPKPNSPPAIASGPFATPNPANAGQAVAFTAAAIDPDGDALTYSWDFGDGASANGGSASHIYANVGSYEAALSITDGKGGTASSIITVTVTDAGGGLPPDTDSDGDGVSDAQEMIDGTNPNDPNSRLKTAMTVTKLSGAMSFTSNGRDVCSLSGIIPSLPSKFDPLGVVVKVDIGGAKAAFTLDASGKSLTAMGSFKLSLKPAKRNKATRRLEFAGGPAAFSAVLKKGSWTTAWADEGANPTATAKRVPMTLVADVSLNGMVYSIPVSTVYSAKGGVGGKFKK